MLAQDVALAERLADAAGAAILPYFRVPNGLEIKSDASPVTLADRAAERAMRAILAVERPGDGIIGEEYGAIHPDAERVWILDPIDGTRSFVAGRPLFTTLIGLAIGDEFALGVIDQPVTRERWTASEGQPTRLNGVVVHTRNCPDLIGASIATTSPHLFAEDGQRAFLDVVEQANGGALRQGPIYGGDAYNYALLASGHIDLVIESGLNLYDFAALVPVISGAGGAVTDWRGRPVTRSSCGDIIAAGDQRLIDPVRAILTGGARAA